MELVRYKDFMSMVLRYSIAFAIMLSCMVDGRTSGYRVSTQDSLSNAFDSVINQLQGREKPRSGVSYSTMQHSRSGDANDCIKSLVDTLDAPLRSKVQKNYAASTGNSYDRGLNLVKQKRQLQVSTVKEQPVKVVKKNKPRVVINTAIDWADKRVESVDEEFVQALNRFKNHRDFGQLALQHVIDLLDVELNLVRHLVAGHTGAMVQAALDERNTLLQRTIPVAVTLYDTILTLATYDNKHSATLYRRTMNGKKLPKALTAYDQKMFLSTIENKIEQYRDVVRSMQYSVGEYTAMAKHADLYDEREKIMNEYLEELT